MGKSKTLITAVLIMGGALAIGLMLWSLSGFSSVEVMVMLVCLFLGMAQLTSHVSRLKERQDAQREVEDLGTAITTLARDMQGMGFKVGEIETDLDVSLSKHNDKMIAQMRSLEALVKQVAEGRTKEPGVRTKEGVREVKNPRAEIKLQRQAEEKLIAAIRKSVSGNKIDLYMQSIVSLPQRKTLYYEEMTQLRLDDGNLLEPAIYVPLAEKAGLMPAINNFTLFGAMNVLRNLKQRNEDAVLFCNISVSCLRDAAFFPQLVEFLDDNRDISSSLIFEFPQTTLADAGPLEIEGLEALAKRGFAFSLDNLFDLDLNYQELSERNFKFLKLDADVLVSGMDDVNSPILGEDYRALLARYGIELIIDKIADERTIANVLDYAVTLGQGALFSEPRPVAGTFTSDDRIQRSATG